MIKFLEVKSKEFDVCVQYRFCFEVKNDKTGKLGIYEFPIVAFKSDNNYSKILDVVEVLHTMLENSDIDVLDIAFNFYQNCMRGMKYDL